MTIGFIPLHAQDVQQGKASFYAQKFHGRMTAMPTERVCWYASPTADRLFADASLISRGVLPKS